MKDRGQRSNYFLLFLQAPPGPQISITATITTTATITNTISVIITVRRRLQR